MSNLYEHTTHVREHGHDGHNHAIDATHNYAEANRAYFDKEAASYGDDHSHAIEVANRLGPAILGVYPFDEDTTTVLDYACARGLMSKQLLPHVKSIVGVDISQGMVDVYNQHANNQGLSPDEMNAVCTELRGEDDELDGQKFDVVVCSLAYHHFSDINKVTIVLACFLKSGGMLIVVDLRAAHKAPDDNEKVFEEQFRHIVPHHDGITETAIRVAFENAGLGEIELNDVGPAKSRGKDIIFFVATGVKKSDKV